MNGEKVYECDLDITGMTDFGVGLDDVLSGEVAIPAQGARIDVAFEGLAKGRLAGKVRGIDHACMRADGRIDMDIHAIIEADDGSRIALSADGVAVPRPEEPIADLSENVALSSATKKYGWVNSRQVWGVGTVDFAKGKVHIDGFMQ